MRISLSCVLLFLVLLAESATARPAAAQQLQEPKIRVLVVTGGHNYEVEPFEKLFASFPDLQVRHAQYPEAAEMLRPELARRCDVVVFYDMWAKGISPEQQQAFVELLNSGIGVVALHHTLAAHQQWPEYAKLIGGKFHLQPREVNGQELPKSGFAHGQDVHVVVADKQHPITNGLADFDIHDETYSLYDTDPQARVLLTTDHPTSDAELAWVKTYGNSRMFFLILGHDHLAYENESFRTLVHRGIRWSSGRPAAPESAYDSLFNGKDLTGWETSGNADWSVEDGVLVGQQGENNSPGDLLTKKTFDDCEIQVTFRVEWPANTGVWYRYQSARQAYQADILEYKNPFALTGSLYCTGKMFLTTNEDASFFDREGWNTLLIRAAGNRHVIFLNGRQVADVRDDTSSIGKIGFQVHPGDQFGAMKVLVREALVRPL